MRDGHDHCDGPGSPGLKPQAKIMRPAGARRTCTAGAIEHSPGFQPRALFAAFFAVLFLAAFAAAADDADPAQRFLGEWDGPANVYDDLQAMRPTTAHVAIRRSRDDPRLLIVETTIFEKQRLRFTRCELAGPGELRVRDDVLLGEHRVKVDGVVRARTAKRIEEAEIHFFVETPQGDYRPYYEIVFAAERAAEKPAPKPAAAPAAAPPAAGPPAK